MSRHRGAKPPRRCELLGEISLYPQGSFYPLSDGPSIRNHRITKPDFRPCSTCRSRSQAPLCLYTLRMISNHSEGTFGRLRYLLGGDRPSQTAHLTLSPRRDCRRGLECSYNEGSIPPMPPSKLAFRLLRLLPILYKLYKHPISSYSKAPWGLSVLSRVTRIFTGIIISPSLSLRQCQIVTTLSCGSELTRQGISLP